MVSRNYSITPHIEFKHIKGKQYVLVDSLSRLRCLGLHNDNNTEESGQEYGRSIFNMDENTVNSINSDQHGDNRFEIDSIKYSLDEKDLANTRHQDTSTNTASTYSFPHMCNLDPKNKMATTTRWIHNKINW